MNKLEMAKELLREFSASEQGYSDNHQHYICIWCDGCLDNHLKPNGTTYQCRPHQSSCVMIRALEFLGED